MTDWLLFVVTKPAMFLIIGVMWIFSVTHFSVFVGLVNNSSFVDLICLIVNFVIIALSIDQHVMIHL